MVYSIGKFIIRCLFLCLFKIKISGQENVPKNGRLILCSNHISNFDPFFHMVFFPRKSFFMGKDTAFKNPILGYFLKKMGAFPVQRGQGDEIAAKLAIKILNEDKVLGMFPEGKRVRNGEEIQAKKGVGIFATTTMSPMIPVALISDFKLFSVIECRIGKPIYISEECKYSLDKDTYYKISNNVLEEIYKMRLMVSKNMR